jgi:hypothetical protein
MMRRLLLQIAGNTFATAAPRFATKFCFDSSEAMRFPRKSSGFDTLGQSNAASGLPPRVNLADGGHVVVTEVELQ